jgi:hypothetical protein
MNTSWSFKYNPPVLSGTLNEITKLVANLPEIRRFLFEVGVPAVLLGGRYRADPVPTVLAQAGEGSVIRFGTSGLAQAIGVDVGSGHVLGVLDAPQRPTILVNSMVDLFTRTVRALLE